MWLLPAHRCTDSLFFLALFCLFAPWVHIDFDLWTLTNLVDSSAKFEEIPVLESVLEILRSQYWDRQTAKLRSDVYRCRQHKKTIMMGQSVGLFIISSNLNPVLVVLNKFEAFRFSNFSYLFGDHNYVFAISMVGKEMCSWGFDLSVIHKAF